MRKQPVYVRLLIATGIILTTFPLLFKEYFYLPDFFRGFLAGIGLGIETTGFILLKRNQRSDRVY